MPDKIPSIDLRQLQGISTFSEIALELSKTWFDGLIPLFELQEIVRKAFTFDAPLRQISDKVYSLELFHGPTLSFKDFGARFMAQLMAYLNRSENQELHILAATSGDTGSAVAHAFLNIPGIHVWILYPKGKVSEIQEKQLTTIGHNVKALEIEGTFDDCQALVKQAFNDSDLTSTIKLTSANSINIARLIPQSFYYFYALSKLNFKPAAISVPSGNFGNLTAGLFAKAMSLPIERFIAATNINDSVPQYLKSGVFHPHPSKHTLSNAMDVGNPSNFARLVELYQNDLEKIRHHIFGASFSDQQTLQAMAELDSQFHYIADPHGAVGYLGLKEYQKQYSGAGIFLETAHPAKFLDTVEGILKRKVEIPDRLKQALDKPKEAISLSNQYAVFKGCLNKQGL